MPRLPFLKIVTIILMFLVTCKSDKNLQNPNASTDDVTTMATPKGQKLQPAEKGPIRSALGQPEIDLDKFKLTIDGLVDSIVTLNWQEIRQLPAVRSDTILMYCVEGWEVWGNWKGIRVSDLLDIAQPHDSATHILFHCLDKYTTGLEIAYLEKYQSILAWEVNGQLLQEHDGLPLRLVNFGKLGYKWAKWVTRIQVMDRPRIGFWESHGYGDRADVPLNRRKYYEGETAEPLNY